MEIKVKMGCFKNKLFKESVLLTQISALSNQVICSAGFAEKLMTPLKEFTTLHI